VASVAQFNCSDLILSLSKLNFVFYKIRQIDMDLSLNWLQEYFEPDAFKRIIETRNSEGAIFPWGPAVILLQKLALTDARGEGGEFVVNRKLEFGKIMMAATVYAAGEQIREAFNGGMAVHKQKDAVIGYLFREYMLCPGGGIKNQIARYWAMLVKYPEEVRKQYSNQLFKFHQVFEHITGLDPELYLMFAASILMLYYRVDYEGVLERFSIGETYFNAICPELRERARRFLDKFAQSKAEFETAIKDELRVSNAGGYDARFAFETPLYRSEQGIYYPLDLCSFAMQTTTGLYHGVLEHFRKLLKPEQKRDGEQVKELKRELSRFSTCWGRLFERHLRDVLESCLPRDSNSMKRLYVEGEDGFKGADFVIHDGPNLVIIEATKSAVPITKIMGGNYEEIHASLRQILFEEKDGGRGKAVQLAKFIDDFHHKRVSVGNIDPSSIVNYCPVIISEQGFPQVNPIASMIRDEVIKDTSMGEKSGGRLEFWGPDELETMGAAIKKGISWVILDKHRDGEGASPMANYLREKGLLSDNKLMNEYYDQFANKIRTTLFGRDNRGLDLAPPPPPAGFPPALDEETGRGSGRSA